MTDPSISPVVDFMLRLKKLDAAHLRPRDLLVLWAIQRDPGMMGRELSNKLGYPSRSNVQICITRLIFHGFIEDRRVIKNQLTPNDLYILPAGEKFLADIMPA